MKPRVIFLGSELEFGRETLTEKILGMLEKNGYGKDPDIVFCNPNSETDKAIVAAAIAEAKTGNPVLLLCGSNESLNGFPELDHHQNPRLYTDSDLVEAMMKQVQSIPSLTEISKRIQTELPRKKTGFDRANPNQPFYAKFGKKEKFGKQARHGGRR